METNADGLSNGESGYNGYYLKFYTGRKDIKSSLFVLSISSEIMPIVCFNNGSRLYETVCYSIKSTR